MRMIPRLSIQWSAGLVAAFLALPCDIAAQKPRRPPRPPEPPAAEAFSEKTGTLETSEGLRLRLATNVGNVRVLTEPAGAGPPQVRYRVRIESGPRLAEGRSLVEQFEVAAHSTPEGVHITGSVPWRRYRGRLSVQYEVTVPRRYHLDISTQGGNIRTDDLEGQVVLSSAGGNLTAGNVGGNARLETQGGHITVRDVTGNLYANTAGGHVNAGQVQGEAVVRSAGGHLRVQSVGGAAQLETAGGNISLRRAGAGVKASTAGGRIDLGEASGAVQARTAGGTIRVAQLAGPTELDTSGGSIYLTNVQGAVRASTAAGAITAWISSLGKRLGASQLECGSGRIVVYLPRELAITIEASVEGGGENRIEADPDIPLKISSGFGQAVRAEAALNGGGEVLRLKVADGSIKLRFRDSHESLREKINEAQKQLFEHNRERERELEEQQEQIQRHVREMEKEIQKAVEETNRSVLEEWRLRIQEKFTGYIPVDADVQHRKLLHEVRPAYPEQAKRERIEGVVWLDAQIDKDGRVQELGAVTGHPVLTQAAMEAVKQWRYAPTHVGGKPVAVRTVIRLEFRLD